MCPPSLSRRRRRGQKKQNLKLMEIHPYVKVKIEGYIENRRDETIKLLWSFCMPQAMWHRPETSKRLDWIRSRFKYFNPKLMIISSSSFYDKKTGLDLEYNSALTKLSNAKRQVTMIENSINAAKAKFKPTLFYKSLEDTEDYRLAICKLNEALEKRRLAEKMVEEEMEKLKG